MAFRDEDKILDQIYAFKDMKIFLMKNLGFKVNEENGIVKYNSIF